MIVKSIQVRGFRNLNDQPVELINGVNHFYGKNGQGKSNLLETVYLASRATSFRPGKFEQWKNKDLSSNAGCSLNYVVSDGSMSHEIKITWDQDRKNIFIDDKKTTSARLTKILPTVLFSPESLSSIKDGPDKRRNLVDEMILSSFEEQHVCQQFSKALKNRNRFLRDCKDKGKLEENLYNSLNVLFVNFSVQLASTRIEYLKKLKPYVKKAVEIIFKGEIDFNFEYYISDKCVNDCGKDELMKIHQDRIQDLKYVEYKYGSSLIGAQKHDVKFFMNEKDSRFFSSQGQQRGLILSLKIAEVLLKKDKGIAPVLLLDDVLSELDIEKKERFLKFLTQLKTQIIVTSTEPFKMSALEGKYFLVQKGKVFVDNQEKLLQEGTI